MNIEAGSYGDILIREDIDHGTMDLKYEITEGDDGYRAVYIRGFIYDDQIDNVIEWLKEYKEAIESDYHH